MTVLQFPRPEPPPLAIEHPTRVYVFSTIVLLNNDISSVALLPSMVPALRATLRQIDAERVWPSEYHEIPVAPRLSVFLCGDSVVVRLGCADGETAETVEIECADIARVVEELGE